MAKQLIMLMEKLHSVLEVLPLPENFKLKQIFQKTISGITIVHYPSTLP